MINYQPFNKNFILELFNLYNDTVKQDGFYEEVSYEFFLNNTINHFEFDENGSFIALDDNIIVGFIFSHIRKIEKDNNIYPGYISTIIVKPSYRKHGIGTALINLAINYLKEQGKTKVAFGYPGTINWPWYIPHTLKHDHNGAPGLAYNQDFYIYLLNEGFKIYEEEDAFHLDLSKYERPEIVSRDLENAKKDGIVIELYDPNKHYGLEEFFKEINAEPFERVIRANLAKEKPNPFAVISDNGRIKGWTGAFYTEESGRAHFDGIIISPSIRGRGLGRALFSFLAEYSKTNGSSFMTFFTGRDNIARNIYMSLGFKIVQSFALVKKDI